jgi:exosortase A-associated hydrolase 2
MKPLFINGMTGKLFVVYWPPVGQIIDKAIVYVPAFAEEMNKSRRMVALQAQALANKGYAVVVLDLYGTGDSAGDFADATWSIWLQDIASAIDWLREQGAHSIGLWGLRTGALLAMDYAGRSREKIDRLLCWQPVLNGDIFATQFLRLRIAAAMMNNNAPQEKTADLKKQLLEGHALEVAGYLLNPELMAPLIALRADQLTFHNVGEMVIFEVVANQDNPVGMANMQFSEQLQVNGVKVSLHKAVGEAFWISQEISTAPDLIAITTERLTDNVEDLSETIACQA